MKLLLFCLMCTVGVSVVTCESLIRIDLVRQKSLMGKLLELNTHPKYLAKYFSQQHNKYWQTTTPEPPTNDTIPLFKFLHSQFYGEILLGSPGQKFRVFFDTSSKSTWVPSALCSPFAYPACATRNKYDSTKSSSYIPDGTNVTVNTDKGTLSGFLSTDKIHLGKISVTNHTFAEIDQMKILQLLNLETDGVVGLGFGASTNGKPLLLPQLFLQHPQIPPKFSIYFNRDETTSKGGHLYLGGYEKKHFNGSITYLPVENPEIWQFRLDKIVLNYTLPYNKRIVELCSKGCPAYPNSADILIYGPNNDIRTINRFLNADFVPFLNRYEVACARIHKLPKIVFYIGGVKFTLTGRDYVEQVTYGPLKLCLSSFATLPANKNYPIWGLGVSFLSHVYTIYDMNRKIGFAPAIENF